MKPKAEVRGFDGVLFGGFDSFATIYPNYRQNIYLGQLPSGDLYTGHFSFKTLQNANTDLQLLTIFREPRSRLMSLWMYWRGQPDSVIDTWGDWGNVVRLARLPIVDFLDRGEIACQADNVATRMLMFPDRIIPPDRQIDEANDSQILCEALKRLRTFDFADVVENAGLRFNLSRWLDRAVDFPHLNASDNIPESLRIPLHSELSDAVLQKIDHFSRLDKVLWETIARERLPGADLARLADCEFARTVARHAVILSTGS